MDRSQDALFDFGKLVLGQQGLEVAINMRHTLKSPWKLARFARAGLILEAASVGYGIGSAFVC